MFNNIIFLIVYSLVFNSNLFSNDWESFNMNNSGISSNSILQIKSIGPDEIWFGTYNDGLSIFDRGSWTQLTTQNSSLPSNKIKSIIKDQSGLIWIGTENGLVSYNGLDMEVYNLSNSSLLSNDIMSLAIDENGDLWIGTWGGGITVRSDQNWTNYNSQNSQLLCDYIEDITIGPNNKKIISVCHATAGGVGGIYVFNNTDWQNYNQSNSGIMSDWNHCAYVDPNENYWIGSEGAGVIFFDGTKWKNYTKYNSDFPSISVSDIVTDHNDDIWASTWDGGIALFNENEWIPLTKQNSELCGNSINDIEIDSHGNRWFASNNDGVSKLSASAIVGIIEDDNFETNDFIVYPNYPNPFNPSTKISFTLPSTENVIIEVFNILGQKVESLLNKQFNAGNHLVEFYSVNLPSGVYFYRIVAGKFQDYKKMVLLR